MPGNLGNIAGTCGVKVIYNFSNNYYYDNDYKPTHDNLNCSAGWAILGFINRQYCKTAYEYWTKRYKLVYQSPVRRNNHSGNDFFFIILDTRQLTKEN